MLGSLTSNYNGGSVKNFTTIKDTQAHVALALQTWNLSLQKTDLGTDWGGGGGGGFVEKKKKQPKEKGNMRDILIIWHAIDQPLHWWSDSFLEECEVSWRVSTICSQSEALLSWRGASLLSRSCMAQIQVSSPSAFFPIKYCLIEAKGYILKQILIFTVSWYKRC